MGSGLGFRRGMAGWSGAGCPHPQQRIARRRHWQKCCWAVSLGETQRSGNVVSNNMGNPSSLTQSRQRVFPITFSFMSKSVPRGAESLPGRAVAVPLSPEAAERWALVVMEQPGAVAAFQTMRTEKNPSIDLH